jgi:hypothetical protein
LYQAFKGDVDDPSSWPLMESLASHGQTLVLESTEPGNDVLSSGPSIYAGQAVLGLRLGAFFFATGRLTQARSMQSRSVNFYRQVLGEEHPDTLTSMNNLAATLHAQGDLPGARALQEIVLKVWHWVLGEEHPGTLTSMNNLAQTLQAQGDLPGARALQEKGLAVQRRVLGEEHPGTLASMNNLALTLKAQGDLPGARALQEKGLAVQRRVLGERHSSTTISAWNLHQTLLALRKKAALISLRSDCLDWLLSATPATLSADQIKIRSYLGELHVPGQPPSRNAPCPCGSGQRYKQCCGRLAG